MRLQRNSAPTTATSAVRYRPIADARSLRKQMFDRDWKRVVRLLTGHVGERLQQRLDAIDAALGLDPPEQRLAAVGSHERSCSNSSRRRALAILL